MNLLIIEDNPDLVANLCDFLEPRGHFVDVARNAFTGLGLALEHAFDAVVLDLMLPGMDGLEVCARLRAAGNGVPVLMLTARNTLQDKLDGFASGADDYLVKPFALSELEARLLALARRGRREHVPERIQVDDLTLDTAALAVTRAGQPIALAPIPLRILTLLMRHSPRVVSRAEIEREVWGEDTPDSDALRAHLHQLRNAIDRPFGRPLLHTVRGFGYRLGAGPDAVQG